MERFVTLLLGLVFGVRHNVAHQVDFIFAVGVWVVPQIVLGTDPLNFEFGSDREGVQYHRVRLGIGSHVRIDSVLVLFQQLKGFHGPIGDVVAGPTPRPGPNDKVEGVRVGRIYGTVRSKLPPVFDHVQECSLGQGGVVVQQLVR